MPRVSVNVGYFRNWWGNWYVVDNRSTALATTRRSASSRRSIRGCLVAAAKRSTGSTTSFRPRSGWSTSSRNLGQLRTADRELAGRGRQLCRSAAERPHGPGRTSTGRRLSDACALKAAVPEQGTGHGRREYCPSPAVSVTNPYCRVVEPYRTDLKGLATYTIPRIAVQVSGTWASIPGADLAANYTVTSAIASVGPQPLGRDLSSAATSR